jgi:hypothetical protein
MGGPRHSFYSSSEGEVVVCCFPTFKVVILSGGNGLAREFSLGVERPRLPRRLLLLPGGVPATHSFGQVPRQNSLRCLYGCQQTRGPSTAQDRPRAGDLSPLGMTEWRLEARRSRSSSLPPFAKGAKDGAPLVYGCLGRVQGSFVGSPWLCQGLRCLRMTDMGGPRHSFDSSSEGEVLVCCFPTFKVVIVSGGNGLAREFVPGVERPRVPRRLLLLPRGIPAAHSFEQVPRRNSLRSLYGCQQTRVPRLRKIVRERAIFLRSG